MAKRHSRLTKVIGTILLLSQVVNVAMAKADTLLLRARQYQQAKRYEAALDVYNLALHDDPKLAEAYLGKVESFVALGWESKALDDCNKLIALAPNKYPVIYKYKAMAENQLEQPKNALADCNKAYSLGVKDELLLFARANAYKELGDYKNALADYTKIMEMQSKSKIQAVATIDLYDGQGELYEAVGQPDKAIADWEISIKSQPQHEFAYSHLAKLYDRTGKTDKAVEVYTKFLKFFPQDSQAWAEKGRYNFKQKKYQEAANDLSQAIKLEPVSYPKLYQARSEVYAKLGKANLAAQDKKTYNDMQR
jgi:tetratricopeptide (TPR) repeat protein